MERFNKIATTVALALDVIALLGCAVYWGIELYNKFDYWMATKLERARQKGYDKGWDDAADHYDGEN